MEGRPPRATLINALERFGEIDPGDAPLALDLGCGAGKDILEMLGRGWRVWAQDGSADGLDRLRALPEAKAAIESDRLEIVHADYAQTNPPKAKLVNASFALPFCPPAEFPALWSRIDAAIEPGGRFSGQLFGDRDGWAIIEDRTHLSRAETLALFDQYVLEHFEEEDRPSKHRGALHKHWHVFHIVARKQP